MRDLIIEIIQPGRPIGEYQQNTRGYLQLKQIIYPEELLPFDIGYLPETLTDQGEALPVLLLGEASHPPHTQAAIRLLGGIQTNGTATYLLAVAATDSKYRNIYSPAELTESQRTEIDQRLKRFSMNDLRWMNKDEIEPYIKQARMKYRMAKINRNQELTIRPAWKPANSQPRVVSYTEVEHYTEAEYTFFQLPHHIQHYVSEYLDEDERILYAIQRPTLRSQRYRSWLGREKLQEGVLILTSQRLIQLVELIPLGDSGVRYGFNAQLGVLERLRDFSVETLGDEVVFLRTKWAAQQGYGFLEWESPLFTRSKILEMVAFLENFAPAKIKPTAIQRSSLTPPSELPFLSDPASNDPQAEKLVHHRFAEFIPSLLPSTETIHCWALLPAWFENHQSARVLVVTNERIMMVTDPSLPKPLLINIPLANLTTLEYVGSVLNSHIGLHLVESGKSASIQISFPYSAEIAFHRCFEAIRRCMAIIPLHGN